MEINRDRGWLKGAIVAEDGSKVFDKDTKVGVTAVDFTPVHNTIPLRCPLCSEGTKFIVEGVIGQRKYRVTCEKCKEELRMQT